MLSIKFSHRYNKLQTSLTTYVSTVTLLRCVKIELQNLCKEFLDYDTGFGKFPLPKKGTYIMLIFLKGTLLDNMERQDLFTTLRPYNPGKMDYYVNRVGQEFRVDYNDSKNGRE